MNDENRIKERIEKVLRENPRGLHILGIARLLGVHRHTVTKYIHELMGAGVIKQSEVGTVKICYLVESSRLHASKNKHERLKR